ncbi:hypothetical protein D7X12_15315 [Corallococcus sicarius]|uniref:Lipoprotein n=2 Tax=Corallococcus sicarius TaxID=2316726 RepID=A0A3A8NE76_9BACT|nr:hypothetical protein D7X12_15315 [Corallococcus sicarius]
MMAMRRRIVLLGWGVLLGACAGTKAPPVQHYALGMSRADYRDYSGSKASPCDAEPRWFSDELTAVNGLLARFIKETAQAQDPTSPDQPKQLALLEEGLRTLPPVLKVHEGNLRALQTCDFRRSGAFPDLAQRGATLVKEAQGLMAQGPKIKAAVALQAAQQQWRDEAPARVEKARGTWCSKDPQVGQPDLYFARQSPEGRTEWLFCDGHRVEKVAEGEPTLVSPENLSRKDRRRVQPQKYLDAARSYPTEEMDRQPTSATPPAAAAAEEVR